MIGWIGTSIRNDNEGLSCFLLDLLNMVKSCLKKLMEIPTGH